MFDVQRIGARAKSLMAAGREREAEAVLRAGVQANPTNPALAYSLGIQLLRDGHYAEGWPLYEARDRLQGSHPRPQLSFPEWDGGAVKSLLLLPEQGFGDQIMFARYAPVLRARGIAVTLGCSPELVDLFRPLGVALLAIEGAVQLPHAEAWAMVGSLPRLCASIPSAPYLPGSDTGSGVGVIYKGRTNAEPPDGYERLLAMPGAVSLQPEDTGARSFAETAEIMRGLASVISIDTAGAHLAGAMGKPTTVLLAQSCDWRWGRGERCEWYPSAQLVRQDRSGDWGSAIERVARMSAEL